MVNVPPQVQQLIDDAAKLDDAELLRWWADVGSRMLKEAPDQFRERHAYLLSAFADKPTLPATIENWISLGAKLIAVPATRRTLAKITISALVYFNALDLEGREN